MAVLFRNHHDIIKFLAPDIEIIPLILKYETNDYVRKYGVFKPLSPLNDLEFGEDTPKNDENEKATSKASKKAPDTPKRKISKVINLDDVASSRAVKK